VNRREYALLDLADKWMATGDIFYRDSLRSELAPFPEYPTLFEQAANLHLNLFPEDAFYRNAFKDHVDNFRARKSTAPPVL
jgi:hypothetical protein